MTYLYHPIDFLPDEVQGLFGYLDDAYFVGVIYQQFSNYQGQGDVMRADRHIESVSDRLEMVRQVLPKETKKIDQMIEELRRGEKGSFHKMMSGKT